MLLILIGLVMALAVLSYRAFLGEAPPMTSWWCLRAPHRSTRAPTNGGFR